MKTLFVILGAAIGAPLRFAIDQYIRRFTTKPYAIFPVSILGPLLWCSTTITATTLPALFVIGFVGAFTTWSTFMLDFFLAYELKNYKSAAINLSASLVFGLLAAWAGITLAK